MFSNMKKWLRICKEDGALAGWICLLVSVGLLIASFIIPPTGVIDQSVLVGVGELIGFGVIVKLPEMIDSIKDGSKVSFKKGELEVSVEKDLKN